MNVLGWLTREASRLLGDDFDADMQKMADDELTQQWWRETAPCQFPLAGETGWADMEEVFHSE